MRMFEKGKPFMDVPTEHDEDIKVFSYTHLKGTEASYILSVGEEYEHVIDALGSEAVKAILDVKPRLAVRLGTGPMITKFLEDARSDEDLHRAQRVPSEVLVDWEGLREVWQLLFDEYQRYYEPEKSMSKEQLRLLKRLTKFLGKDAKEELKAEKKRLPEKLKRKEHAVKVGDLNKERRRAHKAMVKAVKEGKGIAVATKEYVKANEAWETARWERI